MQTLAEILSEREMISHLMEKIIDEATRPWGVKVERVEIKVISRHSDSHVKTDLALVKHLDSILSDIK